MNSAVRMNSGHSSASGSGRSSAPGVSNPAVEANEPLRLPAGGAGERRADRYSLRPLELPPVQQRMKLTSDIRVRFGISLPQSGYRGSVGYVGYVGHLGHVGLLGI